jgi:membrane associated rhomboid family serine protease
MSAPPVQQFDPAPQYDGRMVLPLFDDNSERVSAPVVNYSLITANVLVFVVLQGFGTNDRFTYAFATVPYKIVTGDNISTPDQVVEDPLTGDRFRVPGLQHTPGGVYVTLLTSMFLHGGWAHLLGNMWFLFIFGDNVEDRLGRLRYLVFYLVCGVLASLAHVAVTEMFGQNDMIPSLGASGAISGVLGGYLLLFPTNRVTTLLLRILVDVPAYVAIGLWFVFQLVSGIGALGEGAKAGGVAYGAHIGGFVAGVVLIYPFQLGRTPPRRRVRYYVESDW